jgi:hypothetical protein
LLKDLSALCSLTGQVGPAQKAPLISEGESGGEAKTP